MTSQYQTSPNPDITYPIPISRIANRYYLYSALHISHLRRHHSIPGVLIGSLPQAPQQNVFLGLPLELLPEEARVLVEQGVCYIVDDARAHRQGLQSLKVVRQEERRRYLEGLREQGRKISEVQMRRQGENTERALAGMSREKREAVVRKREEARMKEERERLERVEGRGEGEGEEGQQDGDDEADEEDDALFPSYERGTPARKAQGTTPPTPRPETPTPSMAGSTVRQSGDHHYITPTTSAELITPPSPPLTPDSKTSTLPEVDQHAYDVYTHLHSLGYFLSPGLRFGCQYMAYPGDPLRFHSHFLCRGYGWEEEIDLLDIVGGGRLGTGVKKGFLVGGKEAAEDGEGEQNMRVFSIEWAGL